MHRKQAIAVVLGAALVVPAVALAASPRPGRFVGATQGQGKTVKYEQDRSFRFRVSGGKVRAVQVGYKVTCPSGATVDYDAGTLTGTFRVKDGRFSGTGKVDDGGTGKVTGRFSSSRAASGTIRMQPLVEGEGVEGGAAEQCDSRVLKWTARLR